MYKQEFDKQLAQGTRFKSVMLYGESPYFIDSYTQRLGAAIDPSQTVTAYQEEYRFDTAKGTLSQGSLFGDTNLFVYKGEKNLPKNELKELIEICAKNENSYLIYALFGNNFKSIAPLFTPKLHAAHVRFFEPNMQTAMTELGQRAAQLKLQIDRYALHHLYMVLNMNLQLAINELEKLSILEGPVTQKEIDNLVYATNAIKLENLFFDIIDKKPLVDHLHQLIEIGDDEFKITRMAQYFFHQLFLFRSYINLYGQVDSKAILGYKLPRFIEEKKAGYAAKLSLPKFLEVFEYINSMELQLKNASALQREAILISGLIKIQSIL